MAGSKKQAGVVCVLAALLILASLALPSAAADAQAQSSGFRVESGRLIDANGNDFVMRGVNHPHAWFRDEMSSFAAIKAAGANTVRVVMSSGHRSEWTSGDQVAQIVAECKQHRLVCVLMVHDTTGFGDTGSTNAVNAISLDRAVDYWVGVADTLRDERNHVIINIGNEPFGNTGSHEWAQVTTQAVAKLRAAGLHHTLMVDAPDWGQDRSFTMRDQAAAVLTQDPDQNVVFDVHMFGVYEREQDVRAYIESFVGQQLPLVIGEFGPSHPSGDADADAIMGWAETYGIGYLAWSWSGNTWPVSDLNVVRDFAPGAMTRWGKRLIRGDNGIRETAIEASIFQGAVVQARPFSARVLPRAATEGPVLIDRIEAEHATANGLGTAVAGAGFTGDGYMNGLDTGGDSLTFGGFVDRAGTYDLTIGYRARFGAKTQQLYINGVRFGAVVFPESDHFGRVTIFDVPLNAGTNKIMIAHDWGWIDLDFLEVWATSGGQ